MKIGLITENSQCSKNEIIYDSLKRSTNHEIINFGMKEGENNLTYVQIGLLASILLNTGCVDFIVTGCGTGVGAMMSMNSFPGITCGLVENSLDAYLFSQINAGNSISIPYAKGFGWGSELNLDYIFEKLFSTEFGGGYPKERREPEQKNAKILNDIKKITHKPLIEILKEIDSDFLYETINRSEFINYFFDNNNDEIVAKYLEKVLKK